MKIDLGKCSNDACGHRMVVDQSEVKPPEILCPACGKRYEIREKPRKAKGGKATGEGR